MWRPPHLLLFQTLHPRHRHLGGLLQVTQSSQVLRLISSTGNSYSWKYILPDFHLLLSPQTSTSFFAPNPPFPRPDHSPACALPGGLLVVLRGQVNQHLCQIHYQYHLIFIISKYADFPSSQADGTASKTAIHRPRPICFLLPWQVLVILDVVLIAMNPMDA